MVSNSPTAFNSTKSVAQFFGADSLEAELANIYFKGFNNCNKLPNVLYFVNYNANPIPAFLRSYPINASLDTVKKYQGDISVSVDGSLKSAQFVDLSGATSFADIAMQLNNTLGVTVTYDTALRSLVITSDTQGDTSTLDYAIGALADLLGLSSHAGATISQGANSQTPAGLMNNIINANQNWVSFMTAFEPDYATKREFADWCNAQNERYAYVLWDSDMQATQVPSNSIGAELLNLEYDGVILVYPDAYTAGFICATIASIDFNQHNGRITFAYRGQAGLTPQVTDATTADNLTANGYNFYASYATATTRFNLLQTGQITGKWKWIDAYINQIYLNASLQQAILEMLSTAKSVPYNADGYGMIHASCLDPINAAINFGSIRKGIPLSMAQAIEINQTAGTAIDNIITETGYYLQILPATAVTRTARQSPPMSFWYTDGGSIQQINLPSIDVM